MKKVIALINALCVPIMFLNFFGGIVSGIWLAVLREWGLILVGVIFTLFSHWILSFALIPQMVLALPGVYFAERNNKFMFLFFSFLSWLYLICLITAWCIYTINLSLDSIQSGKAIIPALIWSYGMGLGPWMFFASKEPDAGPTTFITIFFAQIAFIIAIFMVSFGTPGQNTFFVFSAIMGIALLLNFISLMSIPMPGLNEEKEDVSIDAKPNHGGVDKTIKRFKKICIVNAASALVLLAAIVAFSYFPDLKKNASHFFIALSNLIWIYFLLLWIFLLFYLYRVARLLKLSGIIKVRPSLILIFTIVVQYTWPALVLIPIIVIWIRANTYLKSATRDLECGVKEEGIA